MNPSAHKYVRLVLLSVAGAGILYFILALLTPSFGKVIGYANTQPALEIVQLAPAASAPEVRHILDIAQFHFDARPHLADMYWPQPSRLEEKSSCWLVTFASKVPIYRFLGLTQTLKPTDSAMFMSITKSNSAMTFGKWCK